RHRKLARIRSDRLEEYAVAWEVFDRAVLNIQVGAGIEQDTDGIGHPYAVERYAADDDLAGPRIDGDGRTAGRRCHVGPALALDRDGPVDGERSVGAGIERIDLAARTGRGYCGREMATGRGEAAWIAVTARCRNESAN